MHLPTARSNRSHSLKQQELCFQTNRQGGRTGAVAGAALSYAMWSGPPINPDHIRTCASSHTHYHMYILGFALLCVALIIFTTISLFTYRSTQRHAAGAVPQCLQINERGGAVAGGTLAVRCCVYLPSHLSNLTTSSHVYM